MGADVEPLGPSDPRGGSPRVARLNLSQQAREPTVILARHGQSAFNEEGRYQGAGDSSLTPLGLQQAHLLGTLIAALVPQTVTLWSSPLGRALRTAEIIRQVAALDCEITLDERLREVSLGSWDGLTDEEIESVSPGACEGATRFDWFFRAPDGERFENARLRLSSWLDEVQARPGCHVVVSHGLSGRILRGEHMRLPQADALRLEAPQDGVFRLLKGRCDFIKGTATPQTMD